MESKIYKGEDDNQYIEQWKIKNLIKKLSEYKGQGTSVISLIISPNGNISKENTMLTDELGKCSNIKSRVNRQSVESAIVSAQNVLKNYKQVPKNGLCIYTGIVSDNITKEKKISISFEPIKPIKSSLYMCDSKFHTSPLETLLVNNDRYGFIVIDGNGCLYAVISGNSKEILHEFDVNLPAKGIKGGQSSVRFQRLAEEKRVNYITKVTEIATRCFITNDLPNISALIIAGSSNMKERLYNSDKFDQRIKKKVIKLVDISNGGKDGLNQAITNSQDVLANLPLIHEKKVVTEFMTEISKDTGLYAFGKKEVLKCLEMGAVSKIIVSGELNDEKDENDRINIVEWLTTNTDKYGSKLEIISSSSSEGFQFCKNFGIGAILRYKVELEEENIEGIEGLESIEERNMGNVENDDNLFI